MPITEPHQQGFTLIELITVIVIVASLAAMSTDLITMPVKSYLDLQRRTTLVDNAETVLRLMQRDIRRALPNSIRIAGGGTALELLHTSDGGRYRAKAPADGGGDVLDFTAADDRFDVIGSLSTAPAGDLVIYNLGVSPADAYSGGNRVTVKNTSTDKVIELTGAKRFPLQSPQQRFFIVDTPVTYRCNTAARTLLRYAGYAITEEQTDSPAGAAGQLLANNLVSCAFAYSSATATRSGLVTLQITLADSSGEATTLIHQVHVDNAP
ncbi:MAG: type II secretion system protein [Methylomonas sp.]|nr:type II secretion system protein [Methylomonas sp.]